MKTIKYFAITLLLLTMVNQSCKKDWLDKKRDISLIVPTTLKDMRLLLNNSFPQGLENRGLAELASGDYFISNNDFQSIGSVLEREGYIWQDDLFKGTTSLAEWDYNYQIVLAANVILEGLNKITPDNSNQVEFNDIKGGALFMRARAFLNVTQLFTKPYNPQTATADLGIPLRLVSDINVPSIRASLQQTYDQILGDFLQASTLLKIVPLNKTDASRPSAFGMLARCYLNMGAYDKAYQYANLSLADYSKLMDYNTIDPTLTPPFQLFNDEVVFHAEVYSTFFSFQPPVNQIDPDLYNSYDPNDLRKILFFSTNANGSHSWQGYYSGSNLLFGGVATDELYLTRAECAARKGSVDIALNDLNTLLKNRYKTGTYVPYNLTDAATLLSVILKERRKELVMRALRWSDLRRLNKEPQFAVTLTRTVNGMTYTLKPGDPHYTFFIPDYVISASGIQQNTR